MKKTDFINEMVKTRELMLKRPDRTADELTELGKQMPIASMKNPLLFGKFISDNKLSLNDGASLVAWVISMADFLHDIDAEAGVTHEQAKEGFENARTHLITIHRLNYILHECMIEVYNLLEREKRMKFAVKKYYGMAEDNWNGYVRPRQQMIEKTALYTLQDHLRLSYDSVHPMLEKVYETLRDYMIRIGFRDVELKGRIVTALLMGKVCGASYKHFFEDFKNEYHVDYTRCFKIDDLQTMVRNFAEMCNALGVIKTKVDVHGFHEVDGFNPEESQRFKWAWDDFIKALRDDDLMDETAKKAIELNPKVNEEYKAALEEEARRQQEIVRQEFEAEAAKLSEKYNVKKLAS